MATFNGATVLETKETIADTVVENGTPITITEKKEIFTNPEASAEVGQINDDGSVDVAAQIDPIPTTALARIIVFARSDLLLPKWYQRVQSLLAENGKRLAHRFKRDRNNAL